jgi:hypothetical protein
MMTEAQRQELAELDAAIARKLAQSSAPPLVLQGGPRRRLKPARTARKGRNSAIYHAGV